MIIGIAIMISFVAGWQIGISTFYYTNDDNVKPAKRSYLLPPDTLFTSMEYEELECLRLYRDMRDLSYTTEMKLAEEHAIDLHKNLIMEYVDIGCPNFPDLKFWSDNYDLVSLPEFKSSTEKVIEAFKERHSEDGITEFPDSQGVPYKYSSKTGADLILEKDRVVLKVWKNDEPLCIVTNPIIRDVWEKLSSKMVNEKENED